MLRIIEISRILANKIFRLSTTLCTPPVERCGIDLHVTEQDSGTVFKKSFPWTKVLDERARFLQHIHSINTKLKYSFRY